jgi:alpha-amylase
LNSESSSYLGSPTNYLSAGAGASKTITLIYQISGGPSGKDGLVAINFAGVTLKVDHQINTRGGQLRQGTKFYDKLRHSNFPYALVSPNNTVYLELPPRSFSVWVNDDGAGQNTDPSSMTLHIQKKSETSQGHQIR